MSLTAEQIIRNEVLEEAAHTLDVRAGEFLNPGKEMHACAEIIRTLKTCEQCGKQMSRQWDGAVKDWAPHNCQPTK